MNYNHPTIYPDVDNKQNRFITVYGSSFNVYYPNAYEHPKWSENSLRKTKTENLNIVISNQAI
jgi:hypothetical protein